MSKINLSKLKKLDPRLQAIILSVSLILLILGAVNVISPSQQQQGNALLDQIVDFANDMNVTLVGIELNVTAIQGQLMVHINPNVYAAGADYAYMVASIQGTSATWYILRNGSIGTAAWLSWQSTNLTKVEQAALGNTTAGTIILNGVQHNSSLSIPANVMVIEHYNNATQFYGTVKVTALQCADVSSAAGVKVVNLIVENGTSFPSSPLDKQVFYRSDVGYLYVYDSATVAWIPIGYTPNTYPYANLTGVPQTFPIANLTGTLTLPYANMTGTLTLPYGNLTDVPQTFPIANLTGTLLLPYGNLTDVPQTFPIENLTGTLMLPYGNLTGTLLLPYANLTGVPQTFPYGNLTDVPQTFPIANLTGTLTLPWGNLTGIPVLLYADASQSLTANWNMGNSSAYGIYGLSWVNATSFSGSGEFWWSTQNRTDIFAYPQQPYSFMIFNDGGVYTAKNGATGQIMNSWSSTNKTSVLANVTNNAAVSDTVHITAGIIGSGASNCIVGNASQSLVAGTVAYLNTTLSQYSLASASSNTTIGYGSLWVVALNCSANAHVLLIHEGSFTLSSFSFVDGYVYVSTTGTLTQIYPSGSGDQDVCMGTMSNSTTLDVWSSHTVTKHP